MGIKFQCRLMCFTQVNWCILCKSYWQICYTVQHVDSLHVIRGPLAHQSPRLDMALTIAGEGCPVSTWADNRRLSLCHSRVWFETVLAHRVLLLYQLQPY